MTSKELGFSEEEINELSGIFSELQDFFARYGQSSEQPGASNIRKIVFCKDCRNWDRQYRTCELEPIYGRYWNEDDFCNYGIES